MNTVEIFSASKDTLDDKNVIRVEGRSQDGPPAQPLLTKLFIHNEWTAWYEDTQAIQAFLVHRGIEIGM